MRVVQRHALLALLAAVAAVALAGCNASSQLMGAWTIKRATLVGFTAPLGNGCDDDKDAPARTEQELTDVGGLEFTSDPPRDGIGAHTLVRSVSFSPDGPPIETTLGWEEGDLGTTPDESDQNAITIYDGIDNNWNGTWRLVDGGHLSHCFGTDDGSGQGTVSLLDLFIVRN